MKTKRASKTGRPSRIGTLFVLAVLLSGSAVLRLGLEAGPAIARELMPDTAEEKEAGAEDEMPFRSDSQVNPDFHAMLTAFREREAILEAKEIEIQDRMRALEIADQAIEQQMAALVQAEEQLRATLTLADGASENDLAKLTTVYEQMKPKDSAALFEEMDPDFAAGFLGRMKPDAAAAILAGLAPNTAYTISVVMAGKNANVPRE
ncbi:hypothetical protein QEZ52_00820 [Aliisedimentitalea scapharcae]|uniref:Flagellar motility protein MotE (MotC chaperone) n=1 Tax=Aliisedimentitalea scapharcae TaxID=1524259 RepID=A0ABZ2XUS3_9RHOB